MDRLVECVPNFSEGRKPEVVQRLVQAIESVDTACVLDTHSDPDHNRSVITFVAAPASIVKASLRSVALAAELIDMRQHVGQHPRLGATDVLPFVPLRDVTMDECVRLAHEAGECIAKQLSIPVYFYEHAALQPDRKSLENVRRGAYELLREEIAVRPDRAPDIGPLKVHDAAGAVAIGARPFLIAFNVNLRTTDLTIAKRVARSVRARDGGLPYVKALGFDLASRGLVQVSMNLLNYKVTGLQQVYDAVKLKASNLETEIAGTEIVGLVPRAAFDEAAEYARTLENSSREVVLENRLLDCE
jgi:glutamate formiminotransferase